MCLFCVRSVLLVHLQRGGHYTLRKLPLRIWEYIYRENIDIVPLYYAAPRPVVVREKGILMVDDNRFKFETGDKIETRKVRFRTLGCYPLTNAMESEASDLPSIILEIINSRVSERQVNRAWCARLVQHCSGCGSSLEMRNQRYSPVCWRSRVGACRSTTKKSKQRTQPPHMTSQQLMK